MFCRLLDSLSLYNDSSSSKYKEVYYDKRDVIIIIIVKDRNDMIRVEIYKNHMV